MVSQQEFAETQEFSKKNVATLSRLAIDAQEDRLGDKAVPLLTMPGWLPDVPLPLEAVKLRWNPSVDDSSLEVARRRVQDYWPEFLGTAEPATYHAAIAAGRAPGTFFNGDSYRLLGVTPDRGTLTFDVCAGKYFDLIDTSEPLLFETALRYREGSRRPVEESDYRRWLADPFDFSKRCAIPGINNLTIRIGKGRPYFFMHRRTGVGTADGTAHVVPAGEFQPHDPQSFLPDLNIWYTIMREYGEEFCGKKFMQTGHSAIDYLADELCATLDDRRRSGAGVKVWFLGVGLYPLTWKPEVLTVCVFDEDAFDTAFPSMVSSNDEGELLVGKPRGKKGGQYEGLEFRESEVSRYRDSDDTLAAARACLELSWRWRDQLGIPAWN